jgi:hypothetical protein
MNETVNRWLQHLLIAALVGLIGALLALGATLYGPSL